MSEFSNYSSPLVRGLWLALRELRFIDLLREREIERERLCDLERERERSTERFLLRESRRDRDLDFE